MELARYTEIEEWQARAAAVAGEDAVYRPAFSPKILSRRERI
jgi:hypothetical protein